MIVLCCWAFFVLSKRFTENEMRYFSLGVAVIAELSSSSSSLPIPHDAPGLINIIHTIFLPQQSSTGKKRRGGGEEER